MASLEKTYKNFQKIYIVSINLKFLIFSQKIDPYFGWIIEMKCVNLFKKNSDRKI
jgi:hypothetical protein